jgi:hypothetical protein
MGYVTRIVIIGGGPGGYEAALVAAQLGAEVTVVDSDGLGGASVLTDCVPSKTLIATAEVMTTFDSSYEELGIIVADDTPPLEQAARVVGVDLGKVNRRVKRLALAQSHDIAASVTRAGARVMRGRGRLDGMQAIDGSRKVVVEAADGSSETLTADAVLIATGGRPRVNYRLGGRRQCSQAANARPIASRRMPQMDLRAAAPIVLSLILLGYTTTPQQAYQGAERPRDEVAVLSDSTEAAVWAIDGARVSGDSWAILPGTHEVILRINFYPQVSNVHWNLRTYCRVTLEATAGSEYLSFIRTRTEMTPTESLKMSMGIADQTGLPTIPKVCSKTRPAL